jgi:hypothetical protein
MADDLKRAAEDLQSPTCGHCNVAMKWYWSTPVRVEHHFDCPRCRRVARTTTGWPPLGQDHSGVKLSPQFECRRVV